MASDQTTLAPARPRRDSRLDAAIKAALVVLAVVTVASWGGGSQLLAWSDIFPFTELNPDRWLSSTLALWNTDWAGGGDLHYGAGNLLLSSIEWLPFHLGVLPAILQRATFALVLAGLLLASYVLPRDLGITSRIIPRLLGSIAYGYSLGLLVNTPNIIAYLAFLLAALLPILYTRLLHSGGWSMAGLLGVLTLAAQLLAYVFNNPPLAVIVVIEVISCCLYVLLTQRRTRDGVAKSLVAVACIVIASGWWVLPAALTSFDSSVQITTVTDVESWSWTHSQASILNVWRFIASWAWPDSEYFPWNAFYLPAPMQALELWPAAAVALALLLRQDKRRRPSSGVVLGSGAALLMVFLIKGLHPPVGAVNLWIYQHVPGFFLFREPSTKFVGPLNLAAALLLVTVLDRAAESAPRRPAVWTGSAAVTALVLGVLAIPGVTGMVTATLPGGLAPMRIQIPDDWYATARHLNHLPNDGGVALLPNNDYYQMPYTWGFYGVDALAQTLFDRPVFSLNDSPQGYSTAGLSLDSLQQQLVQELHAGRGADLPVLLGNEGVRYVLLRHDIDNLFPQRHIISPSDLEQLLQQTPGVHLQQRFGQLDLYELAPSLVRSRLYVVAAATTELRTAPAATALASLLKGHKTAISAPPMSCARATADDASRQVTLLGRDLGGYTVRVSAGAAPVLLVLNQTFSPNWTATVIQTDGQDVCGATVQHIQAGGFANGWWINQPEAVVVRLAFRPQHVLQIAQVVSGVALGAALLAALASLGHWRVGVLRSPGPARLGAAESLPGGPAEQAPRVAPPAPDTRAHDQQSQA